VERFMKPHDPKVCLSISTCHSVKSSKTFFLGGIQKSMKIQQNPIIRFINSMKTINNQIDVKMPELQSMKSHSSSMKKSLSAI
jgi:hypothetical protein